MNNENNILKKLVPSKILGKGSEGIALQTHNSKYTGVLRKLRTPSSPLPGQALQGSAIKI